jgi:hypothetical protein
VITSFAALTYVLVSAVGNQLSAVYEVPRIGSRLDHYRRVTADAPDHGIDKLVLASLDAAVARLEPDAKRSYLAVTARGFDEALARLRDRPERKDWDRIVIATPHHRTTSTVEGLPTRLEGLGVVLQGKCQGEWKFCDDSRRPQASGQKALTPDGEAFTASRYVAPYLSIRVSVLDARTLAVIESHEVFDHAKYFDPSSDSLDMLANVGPRFIAARIVELVDRSARSALETSSLKGRVDVRDRGAVKESAP